MDRIAVLKIGNGDFNQGFNVTLQVFKDNGILLLEIEGRLPGNTEIAGFYTGWQTRFRHLRVRGTNNGDDWEIDETLATNRSTSEDVDACRQFVRKLETSMKNWLQLTADKGWQEIRETLRSNLDNKSDEIRVIIKANNSILWKLPWHVWDLMEKNPDVEIGFSSPEFQQSEVLEKNHNNQVRILAILGDSSGINIERDREEISRLDAANPVFLSQPRAENLIRELRNREGWDIFFFAGHSETKGEIGWIYINESQSLEISDFKNALREAIRHGLKLAIFNSCDGLGLAQQLADLRIPVVIVMREPVPDVVAQSFLKEFLTEYANGQPLYTSVRRSRERLEEFQELPGATWLPVICQNPAQVPPTWNQLRGRTGGRIRGADWDSNTHPTRKEYQNRQILLNRVRNSWINGVLEKSLHGRALIELGLEERLGAVDYPWGRVWETPNQPRQILPPGTRVIDKFDEMGAGRSLLILGEPGSGKTTTLLELASDLIDQAQQDVAVPMPVVFHLSSWGSEKQNQTIADWLVQELERGYKVSKKLAQAWVKNQQLLLLLDGLDEVNAKRRDLCVRALNRFSQEYGQTEIVICSRILEYEALEHRLSLQSAIYLQSLTLEQINRYLARAGSKLEAVKTLLQEDDTLQELAKSPLMLSVMTLAYQGMSIQDLPRIMSMEQRRKHLFNCYTERMFSRRGGEGRYLKEQAMHWLVWLAQKMSQQSQSVFLIERMQPAWLKITTQKRIYFIVLCVLTLVLSVGLVLGLNWKLDLWFSTNSNSADIFVLSLLISTMLTTAIIIRHEGEIKPVETLKWSGEKAWIRLTSLLDFPLIRRIGEQISTLTPLTYLLGFSLIRSIGEQISTLTSLLFPSLWFLLVFGPLGLIIWPILLLIGAFFYGLSDGLSDPDIEIKTFPNQGIRQSAVNGVFFFALGFGLLFGLVFLLTYKLTYGLTCGLVFGLLFGLVPGIACIQHFTLRTILYWSGCIPWNYARFLDYATERIFLQKVGGGYIFIHRLLQEHFAALEAEQLLPEHFAAILEAKQALQEHAILETEQAMQEHFAALLEAEQVRWRYYFLLGNVSLISLIFFLNVFELK